MVHATRIAPKLYQGSKPPIGERLREIGVDVLILCAMEYQPPESDFPGVRVEHAPLDDGELDERQWKIAQKAATKAALAVRSGKRTLVTCAMGANRSGLVTALTLRQLTGRSGSRIIRHIRDRRPGSLCNPWFVKALERECPQSVSAPA